MKDACPGCAHEFYRRRDPCATPLWKLMDGHLAEFECLRPSCHQKRILELAMHVREDVFARVTHRQFVFTIPKRLRIFFRFDRKLLGKLPKIAFELIREVYQAVLGSVNAVPGMVAAVQTFGELAHWHPHVHIRIDPRHTAATALFRMKCSSFSWTMVRSPPTPETVGQMRAWRHSGFSVGKSVLIKAGDGDALERLVQYIARCPFSLDRILNITSSGHVAYKAEHDACRRFPGPASRDLKAWVRRNFQVFDALDFLAEVTQHILNTGEHAIRYYGWYYGWYSNKSRGVRAKLAAPEKNIERRNGGEGACGEKLMSFSLSILDFTLTACSFHTC